MKTAIYVEDGVVQLVLTPQNEFETNVLRSFDGDKLNVVIKTGQFYDCRGGWTRHSSQEGEERSLIIRVSEETSEKPPAG